MKRREKRRQNRAASHALVVQVQRRLGGLTARQREVALLVGHGGRNKEVANRLNISEKTVKAHLTVIFIKLRLYDRVALVRLVNKYSATGRQTTSH